MLTRAAFAKATLSLLAAGASPDPWDSCLQSPTLPYDRPLELKMRVLDGPDFDLMKYRGSPTLLHIFATWCEPCAIEMPHIVQLANQYASQMAVIGIDFKESDNAVRSYRKQYAIPFPIAMDEDGRFTNALESGRSNIGLPASLYISAGGYLYCFTKGTTKDPGPELTYRIKQFLEAAST